MSAWIGALALAVWVGLGAALLAGAAIGAVWRLGAERRASCPPRARTRAAERHALAASAVPALWLALCLLPGMLAWLGFSDHCTRHADHVHLCLAHPVPGLPAPLAWGALGIGGVAVLVASRRAAPTLGDVAAWRRLDAARRRGGGGFERAASERPFSLVTGLWRPRIWISDALWRDLGPAERAVVLAHERAHVRRRDPLRRIAVVLLTLPAPTRTRASILRTWTLASEQLCDEIAAREVGDRLLVAGTIVAVARRIGGVAPPVSAPSFGGGDTEQRVRSLLADAPAPEGPPRRRTVLVLAALGLAAAAAAPVHHVTEHLIDLLLHLG